MLFDPVTLEPLVNNSAMAAALDLLRRLGQYSRMESPASRLRPPGFVELKCLMTLSSARVFKVGGWCERCGVGVQGGWVSGWANATRLGRLSSVLATVKAACTAV